MSVVCVRERESERERSNNCHLTLNVQHWLIFVDAGIGGLGHVLELSRLFLTLGSQEEGSCG